MKTLPRIARALFVSSLMLTAACAGGTSDEPPPAPGDEQDVVAAKSIVGSWQLDGKADTDFVVTWWDSLDVKADGTFVGHEGGNVCDDDGNCEAGTSAELTGTYTLGSADGKHTVMFHFKDKKLATDRFVFSVSGSSMKMQLAADKQKGGDFAMKRK